MNNPLIETENRFHDIYRAIIKLVDEKTNVDLSSYQNVYIESSINYRLKKLSCETYNEYFKVIEDNPKEITNLLKKIFYQSRNMYDDSNIYTSLKNRLENIFLTNKITEHFRVWIPGAGTGKEAYIIAIFINEVFEKLNKDIRLTLFVTDIDPSNIEKAKRKVFKKSELSIYPSFVYKYFKNQNDKYYISQLIRDQLLFSTQDIVKDPPFSKIDLISCQNLLKLFNDDLKKRILSVFHYALNKDGFLLLGDSERVPSEQAIFNIIDEEASLFQKTPIGQMKVSDILYSKTRTNSSYKATRKISVEDAKTDKNEELRLINRKLLRKNIELEFTQKAFNTVLESIKTDILILDLNLRIIKFTNKITDFFNINNNSEMFKEEHIHENLKEYNLLEKVKETIEDGELIEFDILLENYTYWISIKRLETPNNYLDIDSGVIISFIDKTDIVKKDRILSQQSKMASMGEMITNIAHQWRQPLNQLSTQIMKLQMNEELGSKEESHKIYEQMNFTIASMSSTIDDFRNFFKPSKELQEYKAVEIINNTMNLFGGSMVPDNVIINIDVDEDLEIMTIKNQLSQALLILLNNSIDAIKLNNISIGKINISVTKDDRVHIVFTDNAGGIPKDILDRVFEPYFTTKFKTDGTGVGLYMLKTIVENNLKGKVKIKNIDGGLKTELIF